MNLRTLAFRNMKRSASTYVSYLLSTSFSVMAFFVFATLVFNEQFYDVLSGRISGGSSNLRAMFILSAVMVLFFSFVFIWYSSVLMMQKRDKELATYLLMGMRPGQVFALLFREILFLGILSIGSGIIIGIVFQKLITMLLMRLMHVFTVVKFSISLKAVGISIAVFLLVFIISALLSCVHVTRKKLIDMMYSEQKIEKPPKASLLGSIIACAGLGWGYYKAAFPEVPTGIDDMLFILVVTCVATFFLFGSLFVFIIKRSKNRANKTGKAHALAADGSMVFRLKKNARVLAVIAILNAVTLTGIGTIYTLIGDFSTSRLSPYDFSFRNDGVTSEAIMLKLEEAGYGSSVEKVETTLFAGNFSENEKGIRPTLVRYSDYEELRKISGNDWPDIVPEDNEGILFYDDLWFSGITEDNDWMAELEGIDISVRKYITEPLFSPNLAQPAELVISDSVYEKLASHYDAFTISCLSFSDDSADDIAQLIESLLEENTQNDARWVSGYIELKDMFTSKGILVFISIILAVLFVMATGSILMFKQVMDARDSRKRFRILHNLGFARKDLTAIIRRQVAIYFGLPFIVGVSHMIFAMLFLHFFIRVKFFVAGICILLIYGVIYGLYQILAVKKYEKIVCP